VELASQAWECRAAIWLTTVLTLPLDEMLPTGAQACMKLTLIAESFVENWLKDLKCGTCEQVQVEINLRNWSWTT